MINWGLERFYQNHLSKEHVTMEKQAIFKEFKKYVSLSVFEMACISIYVIADTFFIALALGAYGLTALNISIISFTIVHSFGLMIGIGGATQYTIIKNSGKNADNVFTHSLLIGFVVSTIFVIIGIFFVVPISAMLGATGEIQPMVVSYMRTILLFSPLLILKNTLLTFIRNDNNPKLAMLGTLVGATSNIVFDVVFLFPLALGMFGAALATAVSFVFSVVVLSFHFWMKRNQFSIKKCKISLKRVKSTFLLGTSTLINELSVAIALVVFNLVILGVEGNIGVAAYGIVMNLAIVVLSIFTGVALGIQPLVSRGYGKGDKTVVNTTIKYAIITVTVLSLVVYVVVFFNASAIVSIFNNEENTVLDYLATNGLRIYFIGLVFAGISVITAAFFSAANKPKTALTVAVLRSCVLIIPILIVLGGFFGMDGVWASFVITELLVLVLAVVLLCVKN